MEASRKASDTRNVTIGIFFSFLVFSLINTYTSVLVNEIIDEFSLAGTAEGLFGSLLSAGIMVALLITPLLQGRIKKMKVLTLSVLLQAVMMILTGFSSSFTTFGLFMVCLGIGYGWYDTYASSCIVDIHAKNSGKYLGILHGMFGIGSLLAPIPMQALLGAVGWRGVNYTIAALSLTSMAVLFLTGRTLPADAGEQMREQPLSVTAVIAYLRNGRNVALLLCGGLSNTVQIGLQSWAVRYMLLAHDREELGAVFLTVYWLAMTVSRFLTPYLRVKRMVLVALGGALTAAFLAVGIWSADPVVMCVCAALVGLSSGHFQPMVISESACGYRGNTTLTTSVMMFVMGVTRMAMPLIVAGVSAATNVTVGMSVPIYAALLTCLFALVVLRLPAPAEE